MFSTSLFAKEKLAVMEISDSSNTIKAKDLSQATEYLRSKILAAGEYLIITKEKQKRVFIKKMKKESYELCKGRECQIPLGQALAADSILITKVQKIMNQYSISAETIDLTKEVSTKVLLKYNFPSQDSIRHLFILKIRIFLPFFQEPQLFVANDKSDYLSPQVFQS